MGRWLRIVTVFILLLTLSHELWGQDILKKHKPQPSMPTRLDDDKLSTVRSLPAVFPSARVLVTPYPPLFTGGTSNTAGIIVSVLAWCRSVWGPEAGDQHFLYPPFLQPQHLAADGRQPLADIFGGADELYGLLPQQDWSNKLKSDGARLHQPPYLLHNNSVLVIPAHCPLSAEHCTLNRGDRKPSLLSLNKPAFTLPFSELPGRLLCDPVHLSCREALSSISTVVVTVPGIRVWWAPFQYQQVAPAIRRRFEGAFSSWAPPQRLERHRLNVGLHIRMGDVSFSPEQARSAKCPGALSKITPAAYFVWVLKHLLRSHSPSAVQLWFVTEASNHTPKSNHVVDTLLKYASSVPGLERPVIVLGDADVSRDSLLLMTRMDVLIVGTSGFGRLAAVLQERTAAGSVIAIDSLLHPLSQLEWVLTVKCKEGAYRFKADVMSDLTPISMDH